MFDVVLAADEAPLDSEIAQRSLQRVNTFFNEALLAGAPVFD